MTTRALRIVLVAAALAAPLGRAHAMEPKWPAGSYKYLVIDQDIRGVLSEFGRNIDVPIDLSDPVKGRLRGRLPTASAKEFLDSLCESYGLVWYFDGAVLHVNAKAELKTELISIGRLPPSEVTAKLDKLGIADPRFPVRGTPDAGIVSVSGPPPFISLVRQTLSAMARAAAPPAAREDSHGDEVRVRVFRGSSMLLSPTQVGRLKT
jgi:type III secretion protein C